MKKILAILMALSMVMAATACGYANGTPAQGTEAARTDAVPETRAVAETPSAPENTAAEAKAAPEATPAPETTAVPETTAAPETTAVHETTEAPETTAAPETTSAPETAESETAEEPGTTEAPAEEPAPEPENPAGGYQLVNLVGESGSNLEIVSAIVKLDVSYYLFLNEDGSGSMKFLEADIPLQWDDEAITLTVGKEGIASASVRLPYTYTDGSLQISTRAYSMDFRALSSEELADYRQNGTGTPAGLIGGIVQKLVDSIDGGLVEGLLFDLALGQMMSASEPDPIPEGQPSAGPVSGTIEKLDFTVLGTDIKRENGQYLIAFYFDIENLDDELRTVWVYDFEASQNGTFLDAAWDQESVPEQSNLDLDIAPGRKLRAAAVFPFDPDAGVVSFRISSYSDDSTVLYYADPRNLSGAPEAFVFDTDPSIPAYLNAVPAEGKDVHMIKTEFFRTGEGQDAVRFYFSFRNTTDEETCFCLQHSAYALQDGFSLPWIWTDDTLPEDGNTGKDIRPGEEIECANVYRVRTGSPIVFVVEHEDEEGNEDPEIAWIVKPD